MALSRASWITVVAACALGVLLLAINGYTGYSVVAAAVGASAGVNLLKAPSRRRVDT